MRWLEPNKSIDAIEKKKKIQSKRIAKNKQQLEENQTEGWRDVGA